jgi:hypothetical protein
MPIKRIDRAWIKKLRKDFLTLTRNLPRVKDYSTAHQLRRAFNTYRTTFDELFFEQFLNKQLKYQIKYDLNLDDSDIKWIEKELRGTAWDFYIELSLPIRFADEYWSKARCFKEFERDAPKWKNRLQRRARIFWKAAEYIFDWLEARGKDGFDVRVPEEYQMRYEGFRLVIKGYDPESKYNRKELEKIKEGLRIYRRKATAVFPWLLKHQLPVVIDFQVTLDKGGEYKRDSITFYASSTGTKPVSWVPHVMAHEMGHHLWKIIGNDANEFWRTAIRGDYGDLDIQKLLDKWPGDAWAFQFPETIGDKDPVLALQVDAISHDPSYTLGRKGELQRKGDFQQLLDQGIRTLKVAKSPITGYANKNPEEAMCEAIGLLVAHGPRAVHEKVRGWLKTVVPGKIRLARRVMTRYLSSEQVH